LNLVVKSNKRSPWSIGAITSPLKAQSCYCRAKNVTFKTLLDHVSHRHRQKAYGFSHVATSQSPKTPSDTQQIEGVSSPKSLEFGESCPIQRGQRPNDTADQVFKIGEGNTIRY
jgi:hypothetical protein